MNAPRYNPVTPAIIEELKRICGEDYVVFDNEKTLQKYSHDQIPEERYARMPEVVVMPQTAAQIAGIMRQTQDVGQRATLIDVLNRRRASAAVPALLAETVHADSGLRRKAMAALGQLAGPEHVAGMIQAMWKTQDARAREDAEKAITLVCNRIADETNRADPVLAVYAAAADEDAAKPEEES